jgi:3-dehydroquinate synthase
MNKKAYFKWQYIPLFLIMIILLSWIVFEAIGILSFEEFLNSLGGIEKFGIAIVIITLLTVDIFIPVPSTIVMPLGGLFFGVFFGILIVSFGSMFASLIGYVIGRAGGPLVKKIISQEETKEMIGWFRVYGKWPVLFAKTLPMMAETVSISAGIAKMPFSQFFIFSLIGTIVTSGIYVIAGNYASTASDILMISVLGFLIALILIYFLKRAVQIRKRKLAYELQ